MTDKRVKRALFFYCFFLIQFFTLLHKPMEYRHDALDYWTTGDCCFIDGSCFIHLDEFPKTFRGYFIYLLISVIKRFSVALCGNEYVGWCVFIGIIISLVMVYALPSIFDNKEYKVIDRKQVLFCICKYTLWLITLFFLWKDLFCLPVSDLFSCLFSLFFVSCFIYSVKSNNVWGFLVSGILCYITYNIRVIYLYILLVICIFVVFRARKNLGVKRIVLGTIGFLLGCIIAAFPQIVINHNCNGSYTPRVIIENFNNGYTNLTSLLIKDGIRYPRYETYVGNFDFFEEAGVRFIDPSGIELLAREGLDQKADVGVKDIIVLFYHYPLDTIGIYTKHIFSALTPIWGQCYITDLYINKGVIVLYSITLWYIGILNFVFVDEKKKTDIIYMCLLILPGLLNIIGTVEIRYFFMAHLLLYYYVFARVDFRLLYNRLKKIIPIVVLSYIIVCCVWVTIIGDILSMNDHTMMLIRDSIR